MKRYCRKILEQQELLETEVTNKEECRYEQLYAEKANLLKQKYMENIVFEEESLGDTMDINKIIIEGCRRRDVENLLVSPECELDLWNDMYLVLKYASGERKRLLLDEKNSGINKKIKDTIKNLKNGKIKNNAPIFDTGGLTSGAQKTEILDFGIGVIRLWLIEKNIKQLFDEAASLEKYEIDKTVKLLKSKSEINYELDDIIILEKMLGLNTGFYFTNHIADKFGKETEEDRIALLEKIMDCGLPFGGCYIIETIGKELDSLKWIGKQMLMQQTLKEYEKILDYYLQGVKLAYDELFEQMLKELLNRHSYKTGMEIVEKQRQRILKKLQKRQCREIEKVKEITKKPNKELNKEIDKMKEIFSYPHKLSIEDKESLEALKTKLDKKEQRIIADAITAADALALASETAVNEEEHEKEKAEIYKKYYPECGLKYPYLVNKVEENVEYDKETMLNDESRNIIKTVIVKNYERYSQP